MHIFRSWNTNRRNISNGQIGPSAHRQSTFNNSSNWRPAWKNPDENYYRHSFDDLSDNHLTLQTRSSLKSRNNLEFDFPYRDSPNLEKHLRGRFLSNQASLREIDSEYSNACYANIKQRRPASAAIVSRNQASRKQLQVSNSGLHSANKMVNEGPKHSIEGRRYMSMQNLNGNIESYNNFYEPRQFLSQTSLDQFGMRPVTSLSDRIDSFLQVH